MRTRQVGKISGRNRFYPLKFVGMDQRTPRTEEVPAHELRIDDIVLDDDGEHEITCIDDDGWSTMGITMHGEEEGGEFVYQRDEIVRRYA